MDHEWIVQKRGFGLLGYKNPLFSFILASLRVQERVPACRSVFKHVRNSKK